MMGTVLQSCWRRMTKTILHFIIIITGPITCTGFKKKMVSWSFFFKFERQVNMIAEQLQHFTTFFSPNLVGIFQP